jgi:hypothetical protein
MCRCGCIAGVDVHITFDHYGVYTRTDRCIMQKMSRFSLAASRFLRWGYRIIDFSREGEKTVERRLWATHFLLVPSCRGVVCASVRHLQESTQVGLTCVADWWAWSPLAAKVTSAAGGGEWFMTLSTPRTILGMVHKRSSLHLFGSINSRVPSVDSLTLVFHSLI